MNEIDWTKPIEWYSRKDRWLPARYVATYVNCGESHLLLLCTQPDTTKGEFILNIKESETRNDIRNTPPKMVTKYVAAWWDGSTLKTKRAFPGETILVDTAEEVLTIFGGNTFAIPVQVLEDWPPCN